MSHFAKVEDGIVTQVIVAEQDFINSGLVGDVSQWVQTSYNSNFRKNFAAVGYTYDADRDAFIPPQPYPSWILKESTCRWIAPVAKPDEEQAYLWDEDSNGWVLDTEYI